MCERKAIHQFVYKNLVKVSNLQMVDDLIDIQECRFKSVASNTFINNQIEMKRLSLHKDKCKKIHIGQEYEFCPILKVHDSDIKLVTEDKFLGDIVSNTIFGEEGSNNKNIKARKTAGLGISAQIMSLIQSVSLGYFVFDIAKLLRESMLVGGILYSSEVWYGLTQGNLEDLEQTDRAYLRQVLQMAISSPVCSLYLEMGCTPFSFVLVGRRVLYLHYLVNLDEEEMLYKFFMAQWENPAKRDWTETVKRDLELLNIKCDLTIMKHTKKEQFKEVVKKSVKVAAFNYLMTMKAKSSKMTNLEYTELRQQEYLCHNKVPPHKARNLYRYRVRMDRVKGNYRHSHSDLDCPLCLVSEDHSEHLLLCAKIKEKCMDVRENRSVEYMDIYSTSIDKMVAAVDLLDAAMKTRESLLDQD